MVFQRTKPNVVLKPEEKARLEKIVRSGKSEKRDYDRVPIILMDYGCRGLNAIARESNTNKTMGYTLW
jgi:hypothetical protein